MQLRPQKTRTREPTRPTYGSVNAGVTALLWQIMSDHQMVMMSLHARANFEAFYNQLANLRLVRMGIMPAPQTRRVEVKTRGNYTDVAFVPIEPVKVTEEEGDEMAAILYNLAREVIEGKVCSIDSVKFDEMREEYYKTHAQVKRKAGYWYSPYQLRALSLQDFDIPFEPVPEVDSELAYVFHSMNPMVR